MAGTGGTSSSPTFEDASFLALGVGNLDIEKLCGIRGCTDPEEIRQEL